MAMSNGKGSSDWREERELMQMRESLASSLMSVEELLMKRYNMPREKRIILSRAERRRVVLSGRYDGGVGESE